MFIDVHFRWLLTPSDSEFVVDKAFADRFSIGEVFDRLVRRPFLRANIAMFEDMIDEILGREGLIVAFVAAKSARITSVLVSEK